MQQLPILPTLMPLLAAPLIACFHIAPTAFRREAAWGIAALVATASFIASLMLYAQIGESGTFIYNLGGWPAPLGITYVIDATAAFVLPVISGVACIITLAARRLVAEEIPEKNHALFYTAWMLTLAGMLGMVASGDAFNIFVFLEIASLSGYALIACGAGRDRRALPAAFNYLILGTVGATFYVIGVGLAYMLTGTLNLADLAARLPEVAATRAGFAALAFMAIGLFLKMALFPLHLWLVPAYAGAPSAVAALMAATATKVAVYVLVRLIFGVFGLDFPGLENGLGTLMGALGLIAIVIGTLAAIAETDLRRLFGQSSVAQLGYMAVGIGLMTQAGLAASFIHLFAHAAMKGAIFLALGAIATQTRGVLRIDALYGAAHQMPRTFAAILVSGLALAGLPLTAGFISKLQLVRALFESDAYLTAGLVLLGSALSLVYVWKIVEAAWLTPRPADAPELHETIAHWLPAWVLAGATLWFGIRADALVQAVQAAARAVL